LADHVWLVLCKNLTRFENIDSIWDEHEDAEQRLYKLIENGITNYEVRIFMLNSEEG